MSLDDRPAYRKPHSHAIGLGCEQRLEDPIRGRWIKTDTGIFYRNKRLARFVELRGYSQDPGSIRYNAHRLNSVSGQYEQPLVQLNPIAKHRPIGSNEADLHDR